MRTPQEVFEHHAKALGDEDIEQILADYADDAVLITKDGVVRDRAGIEATFRGLIEQIPHATWDLKTQVYDGDLLLLEWAVTSEKHSVDDGVDTFVFKDGRIAAQTVHLTLS